MTEILLLLGLLLILIPITLQIIFGRIYIRNKNEKKFIFLVIANIFLHAIFTCSTFFILPKCKDDGLAHQDCVMWFALIPPSILLLILFLIVVVFQSYKLGKNITIANSNQSKLL
jgi:hypothetical protein